MLLGAAVDLLRERAERTGDDVVSAALAHVRFTQVAERATTLVRRACGDPEAPAVTTGAIYNLWPNQADFQVELLLHVAEVQSRLVPGLDESVRRFEDAAARSVPVAEVVRGLVREVFRHYGTDPLFRVELGFLIGARDPRVQRALARRREVFSAGADQAWQALLDAYQLQLRPPLRLRDLTDAVAGCLVGAVVLGFAVERDVPGVPEVPDVAEVPVPESAARAALAVFEAFTCAP